MTTFILFCIVAVVIAVIFCLEYRWMKKEEKLKDAEEVEEMIRKCKKFKDES